jgi:hypothetical protein
MNNLVNALLAQMARLMQKEVSAEELVLNLGVLSTPVDNG